MGRIDETRPFLAVNIAVLTVSDTRTLETDTSGATLAERIVKSGHAVAVRAINRSGVTPRDPVCVLGAGPIGILAVAAAFAKKGGAKGL